MYHLQTIDAKPYQLLQELMTNRELEQAGFLLCGGGAIALHLGHRQSTDIDLFTPKAIPPGAMKKFMEQTFGARVDVYSQSDLGIRGFLDGVKFDMIRFPYQMQHAPLAEQNIRFLDLRDAVAMKVHAVANRGLRRDFYDMAEILQRMPLKEVLENYQRQFSPSPMAMSHTRRALTFFTDAEADSTKVDVRNGRSWDQVKKIMARAVQQPSELPTLKAPRLPKPGNSPLTDLKSSTLAKPLPSQPKTPSAQVSRPISTRRVT
ncbi:nucleotidyl transferase AbiEii/AbiGii toxin family protein [Spirosoma sp.]|uniref:nucleotidyl transferase AbiEii/AbiGii toxin family protein n=1 Tax=Spirosoma sp. TaxID=1899569 RepID=UPI0026369510|nr:nucleotidyl transferase AbiEii/AbiGii toxin family protein [Spirosoma sp.]MCX6213794.1 nucleotidyl transferase AbiEii/AbiGii toxin family protein [Spirosoma sp.]